MLSLPRRDDRAVAPGNAAVRLYGHDAHRSTLFADARLARLIDRLAPHRCTAIAADGNSTPSATGAEQLAAVRGGRCVLALAEIGSADLFYEAALEEMLGELAALEDEPIRALAIELLVLPAHAVATLAAAEAATAVRLVRGGAPIAAAPGPDTPTVTAAYDLVAGAGIAIPPGTAIILEPRTELTVAIVIRYRSAAIVRARRRAAALRRIGRTATARSRLSTELRAAWAWLARRGSRTPRQAAPINVTWPPRLVQRDMRPAMIARPDAGANAPSAS